MTLSTTFSNIARYSLTALFSLLLLPANGQELNCNVVVNVSPQVETTERRVFTDMETAFYQFMNGRRWTNDVFTNTERINCNMIITIESRPQVGNFTASVQIQSSRPVYGTPIMSHWFSTLPTGTGNSSILNPSRWSLTTTATPAISLPCWPFMLM